MELEKVLKKFQGRLLGLENVVGVGIGYREVRGEETTEPGIVALVSRKIKPAELKPGQMVPRQLQGSPTDVWEVGEFRFFNARTEKKRPALPGTSIGHYQATAGTFGAVVWDQKTGEPLVLSNNHILANATNGKDGRAKAGDPILQPGAYDGGKVPEDVIAHLVRFVPLRRLITNTSCTWAAATVQAANLALKVIRPRYRLRLEKEETSPNFVDAAVARPVDPNIIEEEVLEIGKVTGTAENRLGLKVIKSGRTTGVTHGKVRVVHATLQVALGEEGVCFFTDQVISDLISRPGDSGSLIFNQNRQAVGLLFAGTEKVTAFNPIQKVATLLGITLTNPAEIKIPA